MRRIFHITALPFALAAAVAAAPALCASGPPDSALGPAAADFARVIIAPAKTSIYIGTVTLTVPLLVRNGASYSSTYRAKVFPFFFFGEHGHLSINVPDADLQRLARGEAVQFTGHAVSSAGEKRRIEGRAVADHPGAEQGKIKIRVWAGKIELIFNSVYRLAGTS